MGSISTLGRVSHGVTLDGLDQNHGGAVGRFPGARKRGIDLLRVLAPPFDLSDLIVRQSIHHPRQFRLARHPVFPLHVTGQDGIALIVAVNTFFHSVPQDAPRVLRQ